MAQDYSKPLFIIGTTTGALLSGALFSISLVGIPALLTSSSTSPAQSPPSEHRSPRRTSSILLAQWQTIHNLTKHLLPVLTLVSASSHFLCAYTHAHSQAPYRSRLFTGAGLVTLAMAPYTLLAMDRMVQDLKNLSSSSRVVLEPLVQAGEEGKLDESVWEDVADVQSESKVRALVGRWGTLNLIRALMPLAGALLAFEAL